MPETKNTKNICFLGIPIDNLTKETAVKKIIELINNFETDKRAKYVATVNVDFMVNSLSWSSETPRHPELLDILRRSDIVTADGMPVIWFSKLIGTPLSERVTGADLVPALMEEASKQNKSVFFLGGKGTAGKKASEKLKSVNPNLIVAGVSSPFVYVEGEAMLEEEDFSLLEEINNSKADILLIAFGNPKQEIWFERNRHRLSVPVSIGIGGTFEFITGSVARAPLWMQKAGLEWIFRILQDPKRLWKRYFTGFFKFGVMALPAILNSFARTRETTVRVVMLSEKERFTVSNLKCGELTSIWRKALQEGINKQESAFFIAGVNRSVEKYLKANKIWDIFKGRICETVEEAVKKLEENIKRASFYYFVKKEENHFLVSFFGRLDSARVLELDFEEFMNKLTAKNTDCILDLSELNFVDSSGLGFLVKIYKRLTKENQNCFLCSVNENVSQLLRITKLNNVIKIFPDVASAIKK